jgi:uncharacterized protein (DUF2062 family)
VGILIGMSPLFGIHTVLGLLVAWLFGLNKFVTIVGVFITNPWTIVPIYTFGTWIGAQILGVHDFIPDIDWNHLSLRELARSFRPLLMPFLVGSSLLGVISSALSYFIIFAAAKKARG